MDRFWLRHPLDGVHVEVTKAEYVLVERDQGFRNTVGRPADPATAAFTGLDRISGTTLEPDTVISLPRVFPADEHFFDPAGEPLDLAGWAEQLRNRPILREDVTAIDGSSATLKTCYLGHVDVPSGLGLYGTAVIADAGPNARRYVNELDQYSTAMMALIGHLQHQDALILGHHCRYCRFDKPHFDET